MLKISFSALLLSILSLLPARAAELLVYSIQRPEHFLVSQGQGWQAVFAPPRSAYHIQFSNRGKLMYQMADPQGYYDWYALDLTTRKAQLIARERNFQGFLEVMPFQRSDGSYYAKVILPYGVTVYRVSPTGQQLFLNKPGLYDFQPLPDGSYAYVLANLRGNESNDFADFIPGRKMQLWHQPLKGKARLLGQFDTILDLQSSGMQLLFFSPGKTQGAKSWKLLSCTPDGRVKQVAEIPKTSSRGVPPLISWPNSDWLVYPAAMLAEGQPLQLLRHHLKSGLKATLAHNSDFLLEKGQGQAGYLTGIQYGPDGSASHTLVTFALQTGEVVQRVPYNWRELAPERALYLP